MASDTKVISDVSDRYKTVLDALIQQNYHVINDVYLDMFISHISGKNTQDYSTLLTDDFTFTWIERSVSKIFDEHTKSINGLAFTCQLAALLTKNPDHFRKLHERNVYNNIQNGLNEESDLQNPSSKLALITLYKSMLHHTDGIEWLRSQHAWKRAVHYCAQDQTVYVVRSAQEFVTDFLFHAVDDENLCLEMITEISRPIAENVFTEQAADVCIDSSDLEHKVTSTINLIRTILDRYIRLNKKSSIAFHIIKTAKNYVNLWKLTEMTHDHAFFDKITQCIVYVSFSLLMDSLNENPTPNDPSKSSYDVFGLTFLNICRLSIQRNQHEAMLSGARLYYILWKSIGDRTPEEIPLGGQMTKFENQIILFQILPLVNIMHLSDNCYPDLLDDYIMKLFNISTEHTAKICYAFKNSIKDGNVEIFTLSTKSIRGILSIIHLLDRERAVIVFQALCHIIKGIRKENAANATGEIPWLMTKPNFMSSVLTALYSIVKNFRITWKDSYESVGLLNCMLYCIENPNLTPRLAVEVLKLAQLSIEHFLAPNLALLVDTLSGSYMQNIGPIIVKRLHDNNWEVRDSVLELLASVANISLLKFPAFQEHILSNGLGPLVIEVAKNDSEFYVRATALNCISKMIPVKLLWEQCFSTFDLIPYLITVVKTECEGVVRKEAVSLITCIYENQTVPSNQLESVYEALAIAATHDLFWEVKVKAIDFWHCVIKRQLQYQGVIDDQFPSVTFSKENKKIVTLNQKEITLRLTKVLTKLSTFGCLGVLLASINDPDDLMVVKQGVGVLESLSKFLDKYNYWEETREIQQFTLKSSIEPSKSVEITTDTNMDTSPMEEKSLGDANPPNSDDVIQSIVTSQDINLLAKTYENQMNVETDATSAPTTTENVEHFKGFREITPEIFLKTIKTTNFSELVQTRTEWLAQTESFSSLLNDMSYALQAHETHDADCY